MTRGILRDRFARYLTVDPSGSRYDGRVRREVTLPDELLLRLLLTLRIDFASDVDSARQIYRSALNDATNEASIDDLISAGWLTIAWGRITAPYALVRAAEGLTPPLDALRSLYERRLDETYHFTDKPSDSIDLEEAKMKIRNGELRPDQVGCMAPDWVASRLWDRALADHHRPSVALRHWFDRWEKLGHPPFVPHAVWADDSLEAFRAAVFAVFEDELLIGWEETRTDLIKKCALSNNERISDVAERIPVVPDNIVDRVAWVFDIYDPTMREREEIAWLVSALLLDVETEDTHSVPHPVATRLIDLAKDSADLFFDVVLQSSAKPVLLADLVLHPATTAVACLLVAQWKQSSGVSDRYLIERDNWTTKSIAFADAVSILGHFLQTGDTDPKDAASLMAWFHQSVPHGGAAQNVNHESLLTATRDEFSNLPKKVLLEMVEELCTSFGARRERSRFSAAVDLVNCGDLSGVTDPNTFVKAYIRHFGPTGSPVRSVVLSGTLAATLVALALPAPDALTRRFLYPAFPTERLRSCSAEDRHSLEFELARSIRIHIRTLSRAISRFSKPVPREIVCALATAIRTGAFGHREKGRIAAFSPQYERHHTDGYADRPIAADIGSAMHELDGDNLELILSSVLTTDEPMLLAQLILLSPRVTRDRIKRRVDVLSPSEAGEVFSLTDTQIRIETLLNAGLADAAGRFIEVERELRTIGRVARRRVVRLRTELRLHLLRGEWDEIVNCEPPPGLTRGERVSAVEVISFYKGLALLDDPTADQSAAEHLFSKLHRERLDVFSYFVNLFAIRISILLRGDPFRRLSTDEIVHGKKLLADAEKRRFHYPVVSDEDADIYICNRAQLLIAVEQPQFALELLSSTSTDRLRDEVAAYTAVALARMDRVTEAQAVLAHATLQVGETDVLRTARELVSVTRSARGGVIPISENETVNRVKGALLDLKHMNHVEQAIVLHPSGSADDHLISHVRSVGASISEMVPMMRNLGVESHEDDLNTLYKELLTQRLYLLGWSVGDQSRGGYTKRGNPGERDLVLRLGTTTVAVLEAVVCRSGRSYRNDVAMHLPRLLAYSTCDLFFLVVYSYVSRPSEILEMLKEISRDSVPDEYEYRRQHDIFYDGANPPGFVAHYSCDPGEVRVVFIVLDICQRAQRAAVQEQD